MRNSPIEDVGIVPKLSYTNPPLLLMRELRDVDAAASALSTELIRARQYLPPDFPSEQLRELLAVLSSLSAGTAEGCRQPLEYACGRLPAIRRQFIKTEDESQNIPVDGDNPPPLMRGMSLDQRINNLISSVTTALDEYRALAS